MRVGVLSIFQKHRKSDFRNKYVSLRAFLVYFRNRHQYNRNVRHQYSIFNVFLSKVQQSYYYTQMCNYREALLLKPISNQLIHGYMGIKKCSKIFPLLILLCCLHQLRTVPRSPEPLSETLGTGAESHPIAKNLLISPTRKFTFIKIVSFVPKSVIPSPSNINFHVISLCKLHLQLQSLLLYHFLISDYMCTHAMLILINGSLMNVVSSIATALKSQSSRKENFHSPQLPMLFAIFHTPFFISNFIKLCMTSTQLGINQMKLFI